MTWLRLFTVVAFLLVSACGYRVAGSEISLPEGVNKVHVELFKNLTKEPYLDSIFTDSISSRLLRQHNIDLIDDAALSEAILSGTISQYSVAAAAYDAGDLIQSYRVTMKVTAKLSRVADGKIVWQGEAIRFQDFVSSTVGISAQEGLESAARKQVAERIAEDLSWQMSTGFGSDI